MIFSACQQNTVKVNAFASRNDNDVQFVVIPRKPVWALVSVLPCNFYRSKFAAGYAPRNLDSGFGIIIVRQLRSHLQTGHFLSEIPEEIIFLNQINIPGSVS